MRAEFDALMAEPVDGTTAERTTAAYEWETFVRQLPAMTHRTTAAVAEIPVDELGDTSVAAALSTMLRISAAEANRRVREAQELGPRVALTGEVLAPVLAHTATAQQRGQIGAEQVTIIRRFFTKLPDFVDFPTREAAEAQLAELACGLRPEDLRAAADRLAATLDQDGDLSDADRARRRYFTLGKQGRDGLSQVHGTLDPQTRGLLEAVNAKWAAPGMCHPDDDHPCLDGVPSPEAVAGDLRSTGQRNHDALKALLRAMLASGQLGSHHGLPVTMVVSTTLKELESGTGHAVTGGGSLLPMAEVIRQAGAAHHYLAVFDDHTAQPLYLGRAKRLASTAQRIMLYAKDRGCTRPGCTVPGYGCQAHHATRDWAHGGHTDITDLTLACGPHNRLVTPGGWTTRINDNGRVEWTPPPQLDNGQPRVNDHFHPENMLVPDDG